MPCPTPLTILAERARTAGYEPWLFHRDGLDWCWRSWGRVADHVARSVEVLSGAEKKPLRVGYATRQHPDAITAGLAIQAAGMIAVPVVVGSRDVPPDYDVWVEVGDAVPEPGQDSDRVVLPPAMSALDSSPPRPLVLDAAPGSIGLPGGNLAPAELIQAAERLGGSSTPEPGRGIVCATPALDPTAALVLEAWTLLRGAAWVLEPQASAFIETVLWARPTMVWGRVAELEQLAARLKARNHRRRSRITSVVVAGGEKVDPGPWRELGVEVLAVSDDLLPGT